MLVAAVAAVALGALPALAWDGTDTTTGNDVTIEEGNLVRSGEAISVFDWGAGQYRDVDVDSVRRYGGTVEVEGTDSETGDPVDLEMNDK